MANLRLVRGNNQPEFSRIYRAELTAPKFRRWPLRRRLRSADEFSRGVHPWYRTTLIKSAAACRREDVRVGWIPGWDSIVAAGFWSGFYFWVSISGLILLGAAEIASHRYSERKDELAAIEQKAIQRRHDEDMAHANAEAAKAIERARQVEESNLKLELRLEEERKNRIALQNALATPHLTPEQSDQLTKAVSGKVPFLLLRYTSDATSFGLAQDIKAAFERANIVVHTSFAGIMSPKPYGLYIAIPTSEFKFISDLFNEFGFNPTVSVGQSTQGPTILVGEKPPPF